MTTRLLIARHGNTFGPGDVVTRVGTTDLPLVESGLEQGRMLGRFLKREGYVPDVVYVSNLQRTQQTAAEAQREMGTQITPVPLDIFNEIDYGPDENKPEDDVIARLGAEALRLWDDSAAVPDGWRVDPGAIKKNWHNFAARILKDHAGKTVLCVTSNGTARFAPYITGDFEAFRAAHKIKLPTGAAALLEHDGTKWTCPFWGVRPQGRTAA
ncbi:MAG: histidine phosphatase family protein [Alphaproteobacteria bacterium]|nr:histidine phosphatase family protein [Alphaproteobacteria bacterium]